MGLRGPKPDPSKRDHNGRFYSDIDYAQKWNADNPRPKVTLSRSDLPLLKRLGRKWKLSTMAQIIRQALTECDSK